MRSHAKCTSSGDHLAAFAAGKARVVVVVDAALQPAGVGHLAVRLDRPLGHRLEQRGHQFEWIGLQRVILEQRVEDRLVNPMAHLIVRMLRIEPARVVREIRVAHPPRRAVVTRLARGAGCGFVSQPARSRKAKGERR